MLVVVDLRDCDHHQLVIVDLRDDGNHMSRSSFSCRFPVVSVRSLKYAVTALVDMSGNCASPIPVAFVAPTLHIWVINVFTGVLAVQTVPGDMLPVAVGRSRICMSPCV